MFAVVVPGSVIVASVTVAGEHRARIKTHTKYPLLADFGEKSITLTTDASTMYASCITTDTVVNFAGTDNVIASVIEDAYGVTVIFAPPVSSLSWEEVYSA